MRNNAVVFELTDLEIRVFWFFSVSSFPKLNQGRNSSAVKFDTIPISTGIIEQGNVRQENALLESLTRYRAEHPGKDQKAFLAIPLHQGFIRSYPLPWLPKRDRASALSLLVDEEIPINRSDLLYDFLVLSEKKPKSMQVLLGATRQSLLDLYVNLFARAGFDVAGVDFALSVLGQALGFDSSEDVLYLQGTNDSLQMVLFRGTVPEGVRSLPSLAVTVDKGGSSKGQLEEWESEIRRFLLYFRTQQKNLNLQRCVWSGDSLVGQLALRLRASKYVSAVEPAEIKYAPVAWSKVLEENRGRCEVAIGYGLRVLTHQPELNLWRQPNAGQTVQGRYRGVTIFAAIFLIIGLISWISIYQKVRLLQQEVQMLSDQGTPIATQVKRQEMLEASWEKEKFHSARIGVGLAQLLALPNSELEIDQMQFKQKSLFLRGSSKDANHVQTLIRTLRDMGWEQPTLSSYRLTSLENVEFSLTAQRSQFGREPITTSKN